MKFRVPVRSADTLPDVRTSQSPLAHKITIAAVLFQHLNDFPAISFHRPKGPVGKGTKAQRSAFLV